MNDIEVYSGISAMEAEQAVLGAMLVDARSVPEVMEGVKVDDFRPGPNQDIYRAIHAIPCLPPSLGGGGCGPRVRAMAAAPATSIRTGRCTTTTPATAAGACVRL